MPKQAEKQTIEVLLKEQSNRLDALQKSHAILEKRLKTMVVFAYIKLGIVLIPIILGIIYIPPIINDVQRMFKEFNTIPFDAYNSINVLDIFELIQKNNMK